MEKQRWEELERRREEARRKKIREEKRREEERRSEKRKSPKKEDAGARKGGNVAIHLFFQWFVVPEGQSRLTKAARAEPSGEMRDEQLHAVVARGIFRSQIVQKTPGSA